MLDFIRDLIERNHHRIFFFAIGWASAPIVQALLPR